MAKKKVKDKDEFNDLERCEYCIYNKGENERFNFMWYCDRMKRYLPQGYKYCRANHLNKGSFEVDKVKYKQFKK